MGHRHAWLQTKRHGHHNGSMRTPSPCVVNVDTILRPTLCHHPAAIYDAFSIHSHRPRAPPHHTMSQRSPHTYRAIPPHSASRRHLRVRRKQPLRALAVAACLPNPRINIPKLNEQAPGRPSTRAAVSQGGTAMSNITLKSALASPEQGLRRLRPQPVAGAAAVRLGAAASTEHGRGEPSSGRSLFGHPR